MKKIDLAREVREFFGYCMMILREDGYSREKRKKMIRNSGLIEKCRSRQGAEYVLHYNIEDWCFWMKNGYKSVINGVYYNV